MTIVIRMVFALLGALGAVQAAIQTRFPDSYEPSSSRYLVWASVVLGGAAIGWLVAALVGSAFARAIRRVCLRSWPKCSGSARTRRAYGN